MSKRNQQEPELKQNSLFTGKMKLIDQKDLHINGNQLLIRTTMASETLLEFILALSLKSLDTFQLMESY